MMRELGLILCCLVLLVPTLRWERRDKKRARVTERMGVPDRVWHPIRGCVEAQTSEAASILAETYAGACQ
jgi:hypothetical protein